VNATVTTVSVAPSTATVGAGATQQFSASATDQFGAALSPLPGVAWSVAAGGGGISTGGLYTAPASAGSATVAALSGGVTGTAAVTITAPPPSVLSLSLSPASVAGGSSSTGTVTLTGTAPAGGVSVALSSSDTTVATVPASVTVPAGATSATFTVSTISVASATPVTISASAGGVTQTATLAVNPTASAATLTSLFLAQLSSKAGGTVTGNIALSGTASSDIAVSLTSSDSSVVVPATVVISAGQTGNDFTVTTSAIERTQVTITAFYAGVTQTATLDVFPGIDLTAVATGPNKITLYWTGTDNTLGYNIYRSLSADGTYTRLNAAPVTTADTGKGVTNTFMYSDVGLTSGTEYFYYVSSVNGDGSEGVQSDEDSAIPDISAISWDSGDAGIIVSQVQSVVSGNLASDEPAVGELTIAGPDGMIYQSFQSGASPQAYASPGHYNSNSHTLIYADGNEVPAPIDTTETNPGVPVLAPMGSLFAAPSGMCPPFKQRLNITYNPTKPPTGIFREVQTQPGHTNLLSYVGLPDTTTYDVSRLDGRKVGISVFPACDTGYIYTGGTAYTTVVNRKTHVSRTYAADIDAGLMLFRTADPKHPGWIPVLNPGFAFDAGIVGFPLENDQAAVNTGCSPYAPVFVTGEPLMAFKAPGYGSIPDGLILLSFHAQDTGNVFHLLADGSKQQVGDITFVRGGIKGWKRSACIVIKRMNSIAQNIKPASVKPYNLIPTPNGPGGGFVLGNSYVRSASWGDINGADDAIDGINVFGYGQWDTGLTWSEGSYPTPRTPSPGNPYVGDLQQTQYFWEQHINLHT